MHFGKAKVQSSHESHAHSANRTNIARGNQTNQIADISRIGSAYPWIPKRC